MNEENTAANGALEHYIRIALAGSELSDELLGDLEKKVDSDPSDLKSRIMLIGYYGKHRFDSDPYLERYCEQVAWLIENDPTNSVAGSPFAYADPQIDGPERYESLKLLWLQQVQNCVEKSILQNAASFFFLNDKELAQNCLLRARAIVPNDAAVMADLIHLYKLWRRRPDFDKATPPEDIAELLSPHSTPPT